MPDVVSLLAGLLSAKGRVVHTAYRTRITLDAPDADLARLLEQPGLQQAAT